jgi:hypothetical protein
VPSPATPEAGRCGRATPIPTCTDVLHGWEGGRNRPQTPPSITEECRSPEAGRIPTAHGPPPDAEAGRGAPGRRARARRGSVAGLWTGLLASPSLRVGRQGHDVWADPVGHPTADSLVPPPDLAPDLQRCWPVAEPVRSPAGLLAGRAQPVDTGVEPVRLRIHRGCSMAVRPEPGGGSGDEARRQVRCRVR